jgi:hypothetical protein
MIFFRGRRAQSERGRLLSQTAFRFDDTASRYRAVDSGALRAVEPHRHRLRQRVAQLPLRRRCDGQGFCPGRTLPGDVKPKLPFEIVDGIVLDDGNTDFQGRRHVVGDLLSHARVEGKE